MKPVSSIVQRVLAPVLNKKNAYIAKLIFNWTEIVGESIARHSIPAKIKPLNNKNILYIMLSNSAIGVEIYYMKLNIIDKITFFLGFKAVDDLKVMLQPLSSGIQDKSEDVVENSIDVVSECEELEIIKDVDLQKNLGKLFHNIKKS
jgi:hypothetical protein